MGGQSGQFFGKSVNPKYLNQKGGGGQIVPATLLLAHPAK